MNAGVDAPQPSDIKGTAVNARKDGGCVKAVSKSSMFRTAQLIAHERATDKLNVKVKGQSLVLIFEGFKKHLASSDTPNHHK